MSEVFELDIKPASAPVARPNKQVKIIGSNTYEYEILKLVDEYDPILKEPAEFFDFDKPVMEPKYLAFSLIETMRKKRGIGLAAPQVGLKTRVLVVGGDARSGIGYAMFNPIMLESDGEEKNDEGCLSFPGLFLPIKRATRIKVAWFGPANDPQEKEFTGLTARIIQHEMDHLCGICYTSLVSPITLNQRKTKVKKNLKLLAAQFEKQDKEEIIAQAMKNLYLEGLKQKYPKDANNYLDN